jgi:hypothetical protein
MTTLRRQDVANDLFTGAATTAHNPSLAEHRDRFVKAMRREIIDRLGSYLPD